MKRAPLIVLGIPLDDCGLKDAVMEVIQRAQSPVLGEAPALVCAVTTALFAKALGRPLPRFRPNGLLEMLRSAELCVADSRLLVKASSLLGSALKERVRTAELVAGILGEAASRGVSTCFLGPRGVRVELPAAADGEPGPAQPVRRRDPGWFRLPMGKSRNTGARDRELVERINESGSGILIVSLKSPRLVTWLERNRKMLRVPVVIGVDDSLVHPSRGDRCGVRRAFARLLRGMRRAAAWLLRGGPAGLLKICLLLWPPALSHQYARATSPHSYLKMFKHQIISKKGTRGSREFSLITLPGIVDKDAVRRIRSLVPRKPQTHLVLDFRDVGFVDSAGFGLLLRVIRLWDDSGLKILFAGLNSGMRKRLRRNRLYGLVSHREYPTTDDALDALDNRGDPDGGAGWGSPDPGRP